MISCKRATELISKKMDEPVSLKEELELRIHLFICEFCEKFQQQSHSLRTAISKVFAGRLPANEESIPLPAGLKERIRKKLNRVEPEH